MEEKVPNFPLLLDRIAYFVREAKLKDRKQEKDRVMALRALNTIVCTLYPRRIHCNGHPPLKSLVWPARIICGDHPRSRSLNF